MRRSAAVGLAALLPLPLTLAGLALLIWFVQDLRRQPPSPPQHEQPHPGRPSQPAL